MTQIIIADVSMSLDNVLAVAGAAKGSRWVLVIGLAIAIVLMAVAANFIAKLLARYPWITWIGLLIIALGGARHDVIIKPAIEAASCSATRTTLAGSMMPALTMSSTPACRVEAD